MARLLTRAQYARKTKYSRARITQLVNQGVIILKNGKVDPAQAEAAVAANIDRSNRIKSEKKSKAGKSPQMNLLPNGKNGLNTEPKTGLSENGFNTDQSITLPSLTDARRDHELIKTKISEVKLKEERGQLVPKTEATKMIIALGSAIKLAFLNLPRRLAPMLKIMTDEREIEIFLRSEIKNIIRTLEQSHHARPKRLSHKSSTREGIPHAI